jgi:hypothetical protein
MTERADPSPPVPAARRCFFAFDTSDTNLGSILRQLSRNPPPGFEIRIGNSREVQRDLWTIVRTEIESAERVIGMVSSPNANVAFELGYALAKHKEVLLFTNSDAPVPWTKRPPFMNVLSEATSNRNEIVAALQHEGMRLPPGQPAAGPGTLFLCPKEGLGPSIEDELKTQPCAGSQTFHRPPVFGWNIENILDQLNGRHRAVWVLLKFDPQRDTRDGAENTAYAAVAGLAMGMGLTLRVYRQKGAREVVDVGVNEREFTEVDQLLTYLTEDWEADDQAWRERESAQSAGRSSAVPAAKIDPLVSYRQWVKREHRTLVPFFGLKPKSLQDVYIERRLETHALKAGRPHLSSAELPNRALQEEQFLAHGGESRTLSELLLARPAAGQCAPRLLLLGEPGAGKTTALRHLAQQLAESTSGPLPLYVSLARWANDASQAGLTSLCALVAQACSRESSGLPAPPVADALHAATQAQGPGLCLLLDGLDEVPSGQRAAILKQIQQLAAEQPQVPLLVSSRQTGYRRELSPDFLECQLRKLDDRQQSELLEAWLGSNLAVSAQRRIAANPRLVELAGNPLMLTLLAKLHLETPDAPLPTNRSALYTQALDVLLRHGHANEPNGMDAPHSARLLLQPLAFALLETGRLNWSVLELNRKASQAINAADLADLLKLNFTTTDRFLEQLDRRGGVLGSHDGPSQPWRFLHRSLAEQLAAEHLQQATDWTPDSLLERLAQEGGLDRWGETVGLLTGLLPRSDVRRTPLLHKLFGHSHELARRLLPQLEGLSLEELWELLELIPKFTPPDWYPKERYDQLPRWDGSDLAAAVVAMAMDGTPAAALRTKLLERIQPDMDLQLAAYHLFALELLLELDTVAPPRATAGTASVGLATGTSGETNSTEAKAKPQPTDPRSALRALQRQFFAKLGKPDPLPEQIPASLRLPVEGEALESPLGSPPGVGDADEQPQRTVQLSAFRLAITPVTVEQFSHFAPPLGQQTAKNHPVVEVSWWHAWLYCRWLGGHLPSEAQWECAARAGSSTKWPGGDTEEGLERQAWFTGGKGKGARQTHPVAQLQANLWGFHDLLGNVWEWCEDWFGDYDQSQRLNPAGPPSGARRVLRGSSAWDDADFCRPGQRGRGWPWSRSEYWGFRVAFPCS